MKIWVILQVKLSQVYAKLDVLQSSKVNAFVCGQFFERVAGRPGEVEFHYFGALA